MGRVYGRQNGEPCLAAALLLVLIAALSAVARGVRRRRTPAATATPAAPPCAVRRWSSSSTPTADTSSRASTPPSYLTDPPTSGPHTPGLGVEGGVVDEPLSPIAQVTTLEDGIVIVQYRDPADGRPTSCRSPAADVVVAPNPDLPSAVIATAWAQKVTCSGVDVDSVQRFIDSVAGLHAGHVDDHGLLGRDHYTTEGA